MDKFSNLDGFFQEIFKDLKCQEETKSYIISIFTKFRKSEEDLSKDSLTILYFDARTNQDFYKFQKVGDWIFFTSTVAESHLSNASKGYYENIGRLSYYSCYRLINRQWRLFEQLADEFNILEYQVKNILDKNKITL